MSVYLNSTTTCLERVRLDVFKRNILRLYSTSGNTKIFILLFIYLHYHVFSRHWGTESVPPGGPKEDTLVVDVW